jgi:FAD/FMN-containing dehydrogenase
MLTDDALQGLRDRFQDRLVHPDHADYDATRLTFNGTIDKRPAAIALPETTEEVADAVRAAIAAGLSIAVRGGGHAVAGHSVADGALVIDLRRMRGVSVDPAAMRAKAGGGAVWEDVDRATIAHDLGVTGGTFWDTGIGGLTLGGGLGFLMGSMGLTCDNLMRATLVTADGSIVEAGPDGDPELLWALRGGGGNFGVVTEFEYRLRPLGPMWFGRYVVHLDEAAAALEAVDRYAADAPDEVVIFIVGPTVAVVTPGQPADGPSDVLALNVVVRATREVAEAAVAPLAAIPGLGGGLEAATYEQIQAGDLMPFGLRHYWKGYFITGIDGTTAEAVVEAMRMRPAEPSFVLLEALTGQARREPEGGAAFGQRAARWNASALAIWEDPADDDAQIAWARRVAGALAPASLSGAGYANYAAPDETAERVRASYGAERFARLTAVKRRYDPGNVFRFNLNIPPGD